MKIKIRDMELHQFGFCIPWSLYIDEHGYFLDGDNDAYLVPHGTASMAIVRVQNGFVVSTCHRAVPKHRANTRCVAYVLNNLPPAQLELHVGQVLVAKKTRVPRAPGRINKILKLASGELLYGVSTKCGVFTREEIDERFDLVVEVFK